MTRNDCPPDRAPDAIRLDKWLWQARFARSRGAAAELIARGAVRLNGRRVAKPATQVRIGDGLTVVKSGHVHALRVSALGIRRGPAVEARMLYRDLGAHTDASRALAGQPLEPPDRVDK